MKITLQSTQFIFNPGSNQVDFSPMAGTFKPECLLAVIDTTTGKLVYAAASAAAGYGGTFSTNVYTNDTLTYASSNAGQASSDILEILYDDQFFSQPISASDGTQVLTTTDAMSLQEGLNVNLLNSSFGGQLGNPIPLPNNNNALSMAFLNGSVLAAPRMDPVTNELIVQSAGVALQDVNLTNVGGSLIVLGQSTMANSLPVVLPSDQTLPVTVTQSTAQDVLGVTVSGNRNNQIEIAFNTAPGASLITNSFTGSGSAVQANGHTIYSTGTTAISSASGTSVQTTTYRPAHEVYAAFTAAFLNATIATEHRIGLFDNSNGFFIGFVAATFGVTVRSAAVDTFTPRASFNVDQLTGAANSKFTRNGVPEAINFALSNLFRIRFAWLGSANIYFEVFSPDGQWVLFHNIRQPNTNYNPSIENPNLPMRVQVLKTGGATNASIATACWGAGTTSAYSPITSTLTDNTLAALTRSVITGVTTGGGGGYVNVKVNPSGSLVTDATGSTVSLTSPTPVQTEVYTAGILANSTTPAGGSGSGTNLLNSAGGVAAVDATGYRTCTVQINGTASSTFGTYVFEYSNDNVNFTNFVVFRPDSVSPNAIPGTITASATNIIYSFPVLARYIRLRLITASASPGTIQAFTRLSPQAWSPTAVNVINSTPANLNATVSGSLTGVTTVTTVSAVTSITNTVNTKVTAVKGQIVRNDYATTNVTTGAYVQLLASTTSAYTAVEVFDSSGQSLVLAIGAAGAEVQQFYIFPGGNGRVNVNIATAQRISVRAVSGNATQGELLINFYA